MKIKKLIDLVGDGKFFTVKFIKRTTGEERKMLARTGVKKGLKGKGMPYDPISRGLLPVYDQQSGGFKSVPAESITEIKAHGKVHKFAVK